MKYSALQSTCHQSKLASHKRHQEATHWINQFISELGMAIDVLNMGHPHSELQERVEVAGRSIEGWAQDIRDTDQSTDTQISSFLEVVEDLLKVQAEVPKRLHR